MLEKFRANVLKQGQGMRGHAAPPHPGIYRVPPGVLDQNPCHFEAILFDRAEIFDLENAARRWRNPT